MQLVEVNGIIKKIKRIIASEMKKRRYNDVLELVSLCARILYQTNIYYMDEYLEKILKNVSGELELDANIKSVDKETILFYDGFGLNDRGLIQIYLKALCKIKRVVYVTYSDRQMAIPDVLQILKDGDGIACFIDHKKNFPLEEINQLNGIMHKYRPDTFFFYTLPDDVVGTVVLYAYDGVVKRYQINLTDHAFWLGAGCIDKCIEFRNYGASISNEYRNISKDKIIIVPFYPIIHKERKFKGYPFEKKDSQKVIFSGGSLYKTLGDGNKYYHIVEYILRNFKETVFWYAGAGDDTEIRKLIEKYPQRVYFTEERSDLYQIMENSYFYLSTYPFCGGLMFQYAAMAGKVPVTLKNGNISDDFLLNQNELHIEHKTLQGLYDEIKQLIEDKEYYTYRSEQMYSAVITEEEFNKEVKHVMETDASYHIPNFLHVETDDFRRIGLERVKEREINELFVKVSIMKFAIISFPIRFLTGCYHKIIRKYLK